MPRYQHDCSTCKFLGEHEEYDLYVCAHKDRQIDTIIARCGNKGPDYTSGLEFALCIEGLSVHDCSLARWAKIQGLMLALKAGYRIRPREEF